MQWAFTCSLCCSCHLLMPLPALPSCPQGATVLNHVTWSPLAQFQHAPVITGPPTVGGLLLLLLARAVMEL